MLKGSPTTRSHTPEGVSGTMKKPKPKGKPTMGKCAKCGMSMAGCKCGKKSY